MSGCRSSAKTKRAGRRVSAEHSAQPSTARPNPMVRPALEWVAANMCPRLAAGAARIADQGCGRLRHLGTLRPHAREVHLVDTAAQLGRRQRLFGRTTSITEYAPRLSDSSAGVSVATVTAFRTGTLSLDCVVCVAVYDALPPGPRSRLPRDAARNLREGGAYVVIVPRNDSSVLKRCRTGNAWADGHTFQRGRVCTFYRNFRDHRPLVTAITGSGLTLAADLSVYRQVCLIFRRTAANRTGTRG